MRITLSYFYRWSRKLLHVSMFIVPTFMSVTPDKSFAVRHYRHHHIYRHSYYEPRQNEFLLYDNLICAKTRGGNINQYCRFNMHKVHGLPFNMWDRAKIVESLVDHEVYLQVQVNMPSHHKDYFFKGYTTFIKLEDVPYLSEIGEDHTELFEDRYSVDNYKEIRVLSRKTLKAMSYQIAVFFLDGEWY